MPLEPTHAHWTPLKMHGIVVVIPLMVAVVFCFTYMDVATRQADTTAAQTTAASQLHKTIPQPLSQPAFQTPTKLDTVALPSTATATPPATTVTPTTTTPQTTSTTNIQTAVDSLLKSFTDSSKHTKANQQTAQLQIAKPSTSKLDN